MQITWPALQAELKGVDHLQSRDILLINHGLHNLLSIHTHLNTFLETTLPMLVALQTRGVVVVWRETTAAHFQLPRPSSRLKRSKPKPPPKKPQPKPVLFMGRNKRGYRDNSKHLSYRLLRAEQETNTSTSVVLNGGYFQRSFSVQQARKGMKCAHHSKLNATQAWAISTNPVINPHFEKHGMSITCCLCRLTRLLASS